MDSEVVQYLIDTQDSEANWDECSVIHHKSQQIGLCQAVGDKAKTPDGAADQPAKFLKNFKYMFDPDLYNGIESADDIEKTIRSACPGCDLTGQRKAKKVANGIEFSFYCPHYFLLDPKKASKFKPGEWIKDGVNGDTNKGPK